MAAASQGAARAGGLTVGLLPGTDPGAANAWVKMIIPTGFGEARNALVIRSAAVVVVGRGWGTLSEIALALRTGVPVIGLNSWAPAADAGGTGHSHRSAAGDTEHPGDTEHARSSPVRQVDTVEEAIAAVRAIIDSPAC
ncbi:TIGR00725 family protein [Frankia sp. Cr2]|uniref:SLOG cluster 4 domain-containing protein n=1 Tax=Frankia sp. Cr2 TaxID=3073932 RepID=UPI003A0FE776